MDWARTGVWRWVHGSKRRLDRRAQGLLHKRGTVVEVKRGGAFGAEEGVGTCGGEGTCTGGASKENLVGKGEDGGWVTLGSSAGGGEVGRDTLGSGVLGRKRPEGGKGRSAMFQGEGGRMAQRSMSATWKNALRIGDPNERGDGNTVDEGGEGSASRLYMSSAVCWR